MSSASMSSDPTTAGAPAADRTARARIRDAAIGCFADDGVAGTSVRAIAAAAEVSPGLVIHHFGSKDALRVACDKHVAALVRERKRSSMAVGPGLDPVAALRDTEADPPLLRYLARTLTDDSPHVAELLDEMVADAVGYMEQGVATGTLQPSDDPYGRAAVLTLWSLGALVLHTHAQRLLGADLAGTPAGSLRYFRAALELLGHGALTPEAYTQARASVDAADDAGDDEGEGPA